MTNKKRAIKGIVNGCFVRDIKRPWQSGEYRKKRIKEATDSERRMGYILIAFWIFALLW